MRRALLWLCVACVAMLGATGAAVSGPVSGDPAPEGEIAIQVSPGTIALNARTRWLTIHANIPYGVVNLESVIVAIGDDVVPVEWIFADSLGDLVVKCPIEAVKGIVEDMPSATIDLSGVTKIEVEFGGSDTVKVVSGGRK